MDELEFAELKDNILNYLNKHAEIAIDLDVIKKDIRLYNLPKEIVTACVQEMVRDGVIIFNETSGGGILKIKNMGVKLIATGGYTKVAQQNAFDTQRENKKRELEIENLKWG